MDIVEQADKTLINGKLLGLPFVGLYPLAYAFLRASRGGLYKIRMGENFAF